MTTMASPKSPSSSSEELSDVQVLDSVEPLGIASFSVPTTGRAQVIDSSEPLVPTLSARSSATAGPSGMAAPRETAGPSGMAAPTEIAGPSGMGAPRETAGPSGMAAHTEIAGPSGMAAPRETAGPSGMAAPTEIAGPSGMAAPREIAGPSGMADVSTDEENDEVLPCGSSGRRIHHYVEEIRSMWNWWKIFNLLGTENQCIRFAEDRGLILREKQCSYHHSPMILTPDANQLGKFRCRKRNCRNPSINRAVGTWFENVRLTITLVFQLMYAFSEGLSYSQVQKQLAREDKPVLSTKTVADWYSYCREAIVVYELECPENQEKIGGLNKIVQIDESKFGRRKYNRGRQIEGHWVLGMIEDGNDDLRLEVCPDNERSAEILVPLIKKHVQEGSIIHTDYWRAYLSLPDHGYTHKRVNHSDPENKFVAPDGTHTQRIESQWRGLKKQFRQEHNKKDFTDWLFEYKWRRRTRINHSDPFEDLLKAVCHVYRV